MKDAVLFDLDGTLLNTIDDIADSANWTLARFGYAERSVDEYRCFVGRGVDSLIRQIMPAGAGDDLFEQMRAAYTERYTAHMADKTRPYDGAIDALRELRAHGLKLCVISNKPDADAKEVVDRCFPLGTFDLVAGGGIYPLKPDPALALSLLASVGSTPERALFLGDTSVDMTTARNAGIESIGATWGFRTRSELEESGAAHITESWPEAATLIKTLAKT